MGTSHVTVNYRNGDHQVTHIYKLDTTVAKQMLALDPNTTGQDLDKWCKAHGGKLDDNKGQPASMRTYDDGHKSWTNYKDGAPISHGSTKPTPPVNPPASAFGGAEMLGAISTTQPAVSSRFAMATASASTLTAGASFTIEQDKPPAPQKPTTRPAASAPH